MYIANVTNDYDNITDSVNTTSTNMTSSNCTNNEKSFDIIITKIINNNTMWSIILCLMSLMVYTSIKPLINKI